MRAKNNNPVVQTIKERCRVCYTCVRECPAKAIKIRSGQAELIPDRCIACGNCVVVCRQNAKGVESSIEQVNELLNGESQVAAIVAPSFPAEFVDISFMKFVGMIRGLGFDYVNEVSFGADLIAEKVNELASKPNGRHHITSTCPAVFGYVKRFHPNLIPYIAPIVSPMVAAAKVLKSIYGEDLKVVFIGPCIAKKGEIASEEIFGIVDEVLTFAELREMFDAKTITPDLVISSDFDPPYGRDGALLPIGGGLLQAADIKEDLITGDVVTAVGRSRFIEAIKEFESDDLHAKLVDVLCCDGCIMGAGMTTYSPLFQRRSRVSRYVRQIANQRSIDDWQKNIEKFRSLDLSREFYSFDQRIPIPKEEEVRSMLIEMGKFETKDELNCGACGYDTCKEHAIAIIQGFAEDKMCLPYSIEQLSKTIYELDLSNEQLANTREALRQSEKLASMGQLAAGIAHELNNPLGVVLMYAHILLEEADKNSRFYQDLSLITNEADRCKKIVSGLLNFARKNKVTLNDTNVCEMINQSLKLIQIPENIKLIINHEDPGLTANLDRDQIIQVINNLVNNAVTAMPQGGTLEVTTRDSSDEIQIIVRDTGCGISEKNLPMIFDPFFTTKGIGQGTGLGLAVSYGIIKMHKGKIDVVSNSNPEAGETGTKFIMTFPKTGTAYID